MEYSPIQLATRRRELAMQYKENMEKLGEIQKKKAFKIIELMDEHGSVSKAEKYWDITEEGQKEIELTMASRGLIELIRSVKTEVDMKSAEAFGQY